MKKFLLTAHASILALGASAADSAKAVSIFDGKTFMGWNGDTNKTWRIQRGAFVGGSLTAQVPRNEFLATKRSYTNLVRRVKFKLLGTEGFVNGGVQVRSERATNPPNEMIGYQCDIGEGWWGVIYDETRTTVVFVLSLSLMGALSARSPARCFPNSIVSKSSRLRDGSGHRN